MVVFQVQGDGKEKRGVQPRLLLKDVCCSILVVAFAGVSGSKKDTSPVRWKIGKFLRNFILARVYVGFHFQPPFLVRTVFVILMFTKTVLTLADVTLCPENQGPFWYLCAYPDVPYVSAQSSTHENHLSN